MPKTSGGRIFRTFSFGPVRLMRTPASRIVFATDYPQEIRERSAVRDFVAELRALGKDGEAILSGNVDKLFKQPAKAA